MGGTDRKLWYMQRLNLFAGLTREEIESLAGRLHDRVLDRRQLILEPESRADRIYLVKTGAVRVYQISSEGRELTTAILRPGQLLGTAALAGVSQQGAVAESLEPQTCVCDATAEEFLRMMSAHPILAAKVMVALARQALRLVHQRGLHADKDDDCERARSLPRPPRGGLRCSHRTNQHRSGASASA